MKKQWITIFASLMLMFTLTAVTPAQSGCKLNEDGTSKCGNPPPTRPPEPTPTVRATPEASDSETTDMGWIYVMMAWLSGV